MSDTDFQLDPACDAPPGELSRGLATEQGVCASAWSFDLGDSLRGLLERSEGEPSQQEAEER